LDTSESIEELDWKDGPLEIREVWDTKKYPRVWRPQKIECLRRDQTDQFEVSEILTVESVSRSE